MIIDFDGTLAHRPGRWSQALLEVLDREVPDHPTTRDDLRSALREGFPWHRADVPHPDLAHPEAWWDHVGGLLAGAFASVGVDAERVPDLVAAARAHYCDPGGFVLYDDAVGALERLGDAGIEVVILSNHVPELPVIVDGVGLAGLVGAVFSSAALGFEKPHPEAFRAALEGVDPARCWMVGDNPVADLAGGRAAGMRAALVRHPDVDGRSVADVVDEILTA